MSAWLKAEAARVFGEDVRDYAFEASERPLLQGLQHDAQERAIHFLKLHQMFGLAEHARLARVWNQWATLDAFALSRVEA